MNECQAILERHAGQALGELMALAKMGVVLKPQTYHADGGVYAVEVTLATQISLPVFLPCEAAVLAVLRDAPHRLTTTAVVGGLERDGNHFGLATVKRALARLVRERFIGSSNRTPRGYWHPEQFPEWRVC